MKSIDIKPLPSNDGHLGRHLVITAFENLTSPMFLVCYALYQLLPETVEEKT